ncbi:Phosphoglucomutase/phosphomannomutase, alpha/beta/alpha domain I family protein [Trichomonas vaginalis G3]|uniref:Phosphoglucomutase/phosphomannomutase, alpha/beta/alpha domain I family protein n=1 Tax=Trichomonas vaginalis (strain ATCC PRA-98 / G3) TaxID=412133 RepID=A2EP31_TRIV3|nr:phosphomannomutase 45a family [Trichomonas vaginalis G3]EAY05569.1 Phosphoglucomutase/phosphomannomutase, alpha/beta/alpha domain I family protein [Trichomonas vaginalis G3]KAI5547527.1 phosphomannomutase 45a family [Trichomonas vaginalis G3]|eukprot:XP_001317792.1 Phosphoglucomutase/phosphomannomutase, alpha/beta/alpha domain I family protein [Trichomonas vaginalis G3]
MSALRKAAEEYLTVESIPEYKETIKAILDNEVELKKYFGGRLAFGTAGIRGRTGPGYTQINPGLILQTAQGYCKYCIDTLGIDTMKERGIVIGYDARKYSREYAEITASIFLMKGIKVYLFSTIIPTPYVAFAIRYLKAAGGVMVTASHNPATDNGYKVYWENGAQIIEPHDAGISKAIQENLIRWEGFDQSLFVDSPLCVDPLEDVRAAYNKMIREKLCFHYEENNKPSGLRVVYSAMHGVGHKPTLWALHTFNLPLPIPVPEQCEGNGDFPTAAFPNPEEGEPVFRHAFARANLTGADLIICQDPDADRVGIAVRQKDGSFRILHGNHTGTLLTWWYIQHFKGDRSKAKFLSSTVSTKMQQRIAEVEGFQYEETLTGFKWLGNASLKAAEEGVTPLLAFEEAIGFEMVPSITPDKDAISTTAVVIEMAHYLMRNEKKSLTDKLDEIYQKYGYYLFNNSYFMCHDPEVIKAVFVHMRTSGPDGKYVQKVGRFAVTGVRDMTLGYDSRTADHKPVLPQQSGQMITFYLDNGTAATIRTSGTEPKIKWYIELAAENLEKAQRDLDEVVKAIQDDLLLREKYNLKHTD